MDGGLFQFDNTYARLPDRFYVKQDPQSWAAPELLLLNEPLAELLAAEVAALRSTEGVAFLAGNAVPPGSEPLAMAYAGHQFGGFSPQLGDGRAILLGEVIGRDEVRRDIQLKGAGRTPFSRMGDGRAALGPALREFIVAEAMAALGAPTTRSLSVVATGEPVMRERALPGAVLARVATSHVRVGTFEYFAAREDTEATRLLADYVINRHYPDVADREDRYPALFDAVMARQARLIAIWMGLGFIHGVMNTDNMSIAGETIDYGPCAFMDAYDPATVYSSIDHAGRYAYANQPRIAQWNLARFAEAILPLLGETHEARVKVAQAAIDRWPTLFEAQYVARFREKFGFSAERETDLDAIAKLLSAMQAGGADFTNTFRALSSGPAAVRLTFGDGVDAEKAADDFISKWKARLAEEGATPESAGPKLKSVNPALIPRNHQVEKALDAAVDEGDLGPTKTLVAALSKPFADRAAGDPLTLPPTQSEVVRATFCGT